MVLRIARNASILCVVLFFSWIVLAENGEAGWLRYAPLSPERTIKYAAVPSTIVVLGNSAILRSAQEEMVRGIGGMLGRSLRTQVGTLTEPAIVIGTVEQIRRVDATLDLHGNLHGDGYELLSARVRGNKSLLVAGVTERGALYGTFAFLKEIARGVSVADLHEIEQPSAPIRWVNQWDNLDGSIERGYGGKSIFFEAGAVRSDLTRARAYARLLASIGINGCTVNNVNADVRVLDPGFLPGLARIADVFRGYGVQLSISVSLNAPKAIGDLDTFDPGDARVTAWWRRRIDELYRAIPDLGGVVVKADSEGQSGPSTYGRSAADAANVIARALQPHGGVLFYRAFVYNHHLDWNNMKADRARAAYDIFHPLDGTFRDNVIVQIKNGPIDFQVREPVSPLFGGLQRTNQAIELQITQEYTGQQRHTVFLVPMWKQVLDFDMAVRGKYTPVREIVAGHTFHRANGGYVGVANVGMSANWLGNHLAMANLYGFGRLAWNPKLKAATIAEEWISLTFGIDPEVVRTIQEILLQSWPAYEQYTGPLGLQTLTNITGSHYGPAPESQEQNGWGQWIRADHEGVGMNRTIATGTGFLGQYSPNVQKLYESTGGTPDDLLLFFHHVPYTYQLHSGSSVIQTIYDLHYDGGASVNQFVALWKSLKGRLDEERYQEVLGQLEYQAGHAIVWRDAINNWFLRVSGIPDEKGRVGHHRGRMEAEEMELEGYESFAPVSWEGASGSKGVVCERRKVCTARTRFHGSAGEYEMAVEYFDLSAGTANFKVFIGGHLVDQWSAGMQLPGAELGADSSVRRLIHGLSLRAEDEIRVEGTPDRGDPAAVDYIELTPEFHTP